jgi:hypothetical protein
VIGPVMIGSATSGPGKIGLEMIGPVMIGSATTGPGKIGLEMIGPVMIGSATIGPGMTSPETSALNHPRHARRTSC